MLMEKNKLNLKYNTFFKKDRLGGKELANALQEFYCEAEEQNRVVPKKGSGQGY